MSVRTANWKKGSFLFTHPIGSAGMQSASRLVIHRYRNTLVLSQIWITGEGSRTIATGHARELEAGNTARDETIVVAAE